MLIGITGLINSGKDTAADYLVTFHGFKRLSYAGALKDTISVIMGWDREMLEGTTKSSRKWREQIDPWWAKRLNMPNLTPRWVMQYWGTDVFRNHFHNDIWIASVENKIRNSKDNVVITDCRFANEVQAIKNNGGITMRIIRGENPEWCRLASTYNLNSDQSTRDYAKKNLEKLGIHASEYSSVGLDYDYYVDNNGTIDDLHKRIEEILVVNL